jgi:cob(I)alamin adenosyltransferase
MLVIFTGDGKGKTSAAVGTAVRASGRGKKVLFIQFVKSDRKSGETDVLSGLKNITYKNFGQGFIFDHNIEVHKKAAAEGFDFLKNQISAKAFEFYIIDELNVALHYNLLNTGEVLEYLNKVKNDIFLIITGRDAKDELIEAADTVTEMKKIKHVFDKGTQAAEGLDY